MRARTGAQLPFASEYSGEEEMKRAPSPSKKVVTWLCRDSVYLKSAYNLNFMAVQCNVM